MPATDTRPAEVEAPAPADRNAALVASLELLRRSTGRFARLGVGEFDDLFQDACVAFLKRFHSYDPARGRPHVYARWSVRLALQWSGRWRRRWAALAGLPDGYDLPRRAEAERPGPDELAAIAAAVARLPEWRRTVVTRVFGLDGRPAETMTAFAERMGITKQAVSDMVGKAVRQLLTLLGETPCRSA